MRLVHAGHVCKDGFDFDAASGLCKDPAPVCDPLTQIEGPDGECVDCGTQGNVCCANGHCEGFTVCDTVKNKCKNCGGKDKAACPGAHPPATALPLHPSTVSAHAPSCSREFVLRTFATTPPPPQTVLARPVKGSGGQMTHNRINVVAHCAVLSLIHI